MGQLDRHDERDCECVKYAPTYKVWDIRLNGVNFICRRCGRYVDPKKWKGGIIKFQTRSRYASQIECPCCGYRMSRHRRDKNALVQSIKHQQKYPEKHDKRSLKRLKKKVKIIESEILAPRIH